MLVVFFGFLIGALAGQAEDLAYVVDFCTANPGTCTNTGTYCVEGDLVFRQFFVCNSDNLIVGHTNNLDGSIPTTIGGVVNMRFLTIDRAGNVAYAIPTELGKLTALTSLELTSSSLGVGLIGNIPSELGRLSNLQVFKLQRHYLAIGVSLPSQIAAGWSSIKDFTLDEVSLGGTIPTAIGPSWRDTINKFTMTSNAFVATSLPRFSHAPNLEKYTVSLNVGDITYDDPLLFSSPILKEVSISGNANLHGTIPSASVYGSESLETLSLGVNGITGLSFQLTSEISKLNGTLKSLFLSDVNIGGSLPTELGELSRLTVLGAYFTQLSGTIPEEIQALQSLESLVLASPGVFDCSTHTTLYGPLPEGVAELAWGGASSLTRLTLIGNCLTGTIPGGLLRNSGLLSGDVIITATAFVDPLPPWLTTIAHERPAPFCNLLSNRFCHVPRPYQQSELLCPISLNGVIDACGECDGDGTSCIDCAGVQHGTSVYDLCGVCNGNSQDCLDCNGVPFGTSRFDSCSVCNGADNTCQDCAGSSTGSLVYDRCGVCGGNGQSCVDCFGRLFGNATVDDCGVCGGEGRTCTDCSGAINGSKTIDDCGLCVDVRSESYRPECFDCSGQANGTQIRDICGTCPASLRCDPGDIAFRGLLIRFWWGWWVILFLLLLSMFIVLFGWCLSQRQKQA